MARPATIGKKPHTQHVVCGLKTFGFFFFQLMELSIGIYLNTKCKILAVSIVTIDLLISRATL